MSSAEAAEEERSDPYPKAQNTGHKVKSNVSKDKELFAVSLACCEMADFKYEDSPPSS